MSGRFARSARVAAAAGGVALLLAIAAWSLAHSGAVDAWLTTQIAARVAPWVRFSGARAVWWPRPAVVLDNVAAVPVAGAAAQGAATAAAVTCRIRLTALLAGQVEIGSVRVDGLRVAIERGPDGQLYAGGLETLTAAPDNEPLPAIPAVRIRGAEIDYRSGTAAGSAGLRRVDAQWTPDGDGGGGELSAEVDGGGSIAVRGDVDTLANFAAARYRATIEADDLDAARAVALLPLPHELAAQGRLRVTATVSGEGAAVSLSNAALELADGVLRWAEWHAATPLRVATELRWDGTRLTLSAGRADAARLSRGALAAEDIETSFTYDDGALQIGPGQLRACGGTWRPAGRVRFGDAVQVDGTVQAQNVDGAELGRMLSALGVPGPLPQLSAPLQLSVQVSGARGGAWSGRAGVETAGGATWSNAQLDGPLQVSADAVLTPTAVTLSNGRLQASRIALGSVAVAAVSGGFGYDGSAVQVSDLRGSAFGGTWTYSGSLPVSATASWNGQLGGTGVNAGALQTAVAAPGSAAPIAGAVDVRAQLTGTGTRALSADVSTRLASPILQWQDLQVESPADASGALRLRDGRLAVSNGRARARLVRARGVAASDVDTSYDYAGTTLRVSALGARAFGGQWRGNGVIGIDAMPSWSGTVEAQRVDFDALLDEIPGVDGPHGSAIADLSLTITHASDDDATGSATVALSAGSFVWDDFQVEGPARGRAAFAMRGGKIDLTEATAQAARAGYGPLSGSAANAAFEYVGKRLTFSDLRFTSCGGTWTHNGWFIVDDGGQFAGQLRVQGAVPHQVIGMFVQDQSEISFARVDLDSEFTGEVVSDWLPRLRATGTVVMSDGTMRAATVLGPIWEALFGAGRVAQALSRPTTHVRELSESFTLRRGRFETSDLTLLSDDYNATALGSIGLDGSIDLSARIQLSAQGVQKLLVLGALPLPTSALPSLPPIPARVSGDLEHPIIRPNVSALPASTLKWVVETLVQTPRSLGGAVVERVGQAWNGVKRLVGGAEGE